MNILSWSSDIKRLPFFYEKKYKDLSNIQTIEETKDNNNKEKNENKIKEKKDTININNIFISGPREMHTINGLLFINGKLIHEKNGKMIRENLIMKILDNKIIDLYRIFNGVYYSFKLQIFRNKPYFIVIGGNFNEFMIDSKLELFMISSIKIYDATDFIINKNGKYPPENLSNSKEEPYPKLLLKNIKLMKRLEDGKIMCEIDELSMKKYESFQNINSFAINSEFTHAAISLDKGDIILIYGFPNLIECDNSSLTMMYLPKINIRDKGHVTNLFFTEINKFNYIKMILYASTSKIIYYYEWKKNQKSKEENIIKLKILNPGGPGGYSGCIDIKNQYLLMGSSLDDFICEFENLEISKTWFFEGKKTHVYYFKDYILFVVGGENNSSLQIYDKKNSFFIYYKELKKKIIGLCCDNNNIYVVYEKNPNYKYIVKLTEKSLKEKIQLLFNKKYFELAIIYAESYNFDQLTISNISKLYAEHEYNNKNYNSSINQYIKTIGFYDPSYVIQKFNNYKKIDYLILYLEKLLEYCETKNKINEEYNNYSKLLLSYYIFRDKIKKFKEYINKKSAFLSNELLKFIINLCIEINETEFALNYLKQKKIYISYIELLFTLNKKEEALNFIRKLSKEEKPLIPNNTINIKKDSLLSHYQIGEIDVNTRKYSVKISTIVPLKEMQNIFNKVIILFLNEDDNDNNNKTKINKNSIAYEFFEIFMIFIYKNYQNIQAKDLNTLIHNFLFFDKYFIMLFDKLISYQISFDDKIIHRRIELYLNELYNESINNEKEKEIIRKNIIDLLSNKKYKNIYDIQYLMLLFKYYNFNEGIKLLSEQTKTFKDIILILFDNKEYKQVLSIFEKNSIKETSIWVMTLHLFLQEIKINKNDEKEKIILDICFQEFLSKIVDNNIISPIEILDIISEVNDEVPIKLIKDFFLNAIENENKNLVNNLIKSKEYEANIHEIDEEINNLKEKPLNLRLTKCDECNMGIEYPVIFFKCGHYFHYICLNYYIKDFRNAHCPKCIVFRKQILNKNLESQKIYQSLNSEENLEKELNKHDNHIDFINMLYSKGLFRFNTTRKSTYKNRK